MKHSFLLSLFTVTSALFLSGCASNTTVEPPNSEVEVVTPTPVNVTPSPSTPTRSLQTYELNDIILEQMTGEEGEKFLYLTKHLTDTTATLESIHHGYFTQSEYNELLVTYLVEDAPQIHGLSPTFLFIVDVFTGKLNSTHFITADQVDVFLLPSPMGTKVLILEESLVDGGAKSSSATLYSCLSGSWSASSVISQFSTLPVVDDAQLPLASNYIYTYHGDTLTIETQTISSHREEVSETLNEEENGEVNEEENEEQLEEEWEHADPEGGEERSVEVALYGTYQWNYDLSTFETAF